MRSAAAWRKHALEISTVAEPLLRQRPMDLQPPWQGVQGTNWGRGLRDAAGQRCMQLLLDAAIAAKSESAQLQHCGLLCSMLKYNSCQVKGKSCLNAGSIAVAATLTAKWATDGAAAVTSSQRASMRAIVARWCMGWAEELGRYSKCAAIKAVGAAGRQSSTHAGSSDGSSSSGNGSSGTWQQGLGSDVEAILELLDAWRGSQTGPTPAAVPLSKSMLEQSTTSQHAQRSPCT